MDTTHQQIKLKFSHIPAITQKALDLLSKQDWIRKNDWYLAGGTALTLQLNHRTSVDLDFFTQHISFIAYPYFVPKQPFITYGGIDILDAKDIAVMKIIAISQRGRKRDFFDLYWYLL